jgi:hypothetical protein
MKQVEESSGWAIFVVNLEQVAGGALQVKTLSAICIRPSSVVGNSEASALVTTEELSQHCRESRQRSIWTRLNRQSDPIRNAGISFCFRSRYRVLLWMRRYSVTSLTVIMSPLSNLAPVDFPVPSPLMCKSA